MKSLLLVTIILSLLLPAGCTTMQKVGADVGVVAQKVCDFDAATSVDAQTAINFISMVAPSVGKIVGVALTQDQATAILTSVANAVPGITCVALTDLQNALAFFDSLSAQYNAKVASTKGVKPMKAPSILHLRIKAQG